MIGDTAKVTRSASAEEYHGPDDDKKVGATIGVEEEFHVLDPKTGELVAEAVSLLANPSGDHDPEAELLRSAIERQFEILGDKLAQLSSADHRLAASITDAARLIELRDILLHETPAISDRVVWEIVRTRLPVLRDEVFSLLNRR